MAYTQATRIVDLAQDVLEFLRQYDLSASEAEEVLREALGFVPHTAKISPFSHKE